VAQEKPSPVRRVITGHSAQRKAVVVSDAVATVISQREYASSTTIWSSLSVPVKVAAEGFPEDPATAHAGSGAPKNGVRFMIMELEPGCSGNMHRTDTVDLVICLEGEVKMLLTESNVYLKPGDVLVQQSTEHAWTNPGSIRAKLAITLIDAVPLGPEYPPSRTSGRRK
jgi:quercetin dioxygenase-like cupin family protein